MATSSYAQMFDEIMRREMTGLLERVAKGEGLELTDLVAKYLPSDVKPATELKKTTTTTKAAAARKPTKVVTRPEESDGASSSKCNATTAKGKPCSLPPLAGKCVCRVHDAKQKKDDAAVVVPTTSTGPIKKPKTKKKADQPKHDHPLDEKVHEDCELCNTHGSALDDTDVDEEFETVKSPPKTLRERLMKLGSYEEEED